MGEHHIDNHDTGIGAERETTQLRFPAEIEKSYRQEYIRKSLPFIRVALGLGIILYSIFGILDIFMAPLSRDQIWFIRFAIVVPALALTLVITWFRIFTKLLDILMSLDSLLAGIGIVAMIAISKDPGATRYYYAGLILVMMWAYTFTRIRFVYATVTCWIVVAAYEFTGIYIQKMLEDRELLVVFINNNFFFIAANIMGMVINFLFERYARRDYVNRMLIVEKQDQIEVERNELYEKNQIIKHELALARKIQQHMIPQVQPNANIFSIYRPMEEVGGDFYDFTSMDSANLVGVFLSDVAGHGVPAAFITSMIKSMVSQSTHLAKNPAKLLSYLNESLVDQIDERFVTAFYGVMNIRDRSFVYANAGHNPPFVCLDDKVMKLKFTKRHVPFGFISNKEMAKNGVAYRNYRVALPEGSKLVLYTDGLVEARSGLNDGTDFSDVIEEKMLKIRTRSPREFVEGLLRELIEFRGGEKFDDDICIICMDVV